MNEFIVLKVGDGVIIIGPLGVVLLFILGALTWKLIKIILKK